MASDDDTRRRTRVRVAGALVAVLVMAGIAALVTAWLTGSQGSGTAGHAAGRPALASGQTLAPGRVLRSPDGAAVARMQTGGNFVISVAGAEVWSSGTNGYPGAHVTMQTNGDMVVRSRAGAVLWTSSSIGAADSDAALGNDGDLMITTGARTVWSSGGGLIGSTLAAGQSLGSGQALTSLDGTVTATMEGDGDFVVADNGAPVWSTGTSGNPGAHITMGTDGDLVVESASGGTLWSSGSTGARSPRVVLEDGGNLVLYSNDIPVWERTRGLTGARADSLYWGAYIDTSLGSAPWSTAALHAFERDAGKNVSIIHWGEAWYANGTGQPFWSVNANEARSVGAIPLIDWGSWDSANLGLPDQAAFSLSAIIDGTYDTYITAWAKAAKAWGHPFFLRFDWEMNGNWFPWGAGVNGNTSPAEYVAAWRHVHDIFTAVGAANVNWVWCPDIIKPGGTPLAEFYPGNKYVDWIAMDGYNEGTGQGGTWQTFDQVFGYTYDQLRALAPGKPIMIAETASDESGGSKAAWITDALTTQIPENFPDVKALVWFNWDVQGYDWDIESSPGAQAAFTSGIAAPNYLPNQYANLASSPIPAP